LLARADAVIDHSDASSIPRLLPFDGSIAAEQARPAAMTSVTQITNSLLRRA